MFDPLELALPEDDAMYQWHSAGFVRVLLERSRRRIHYWSPQWPTTRLVKSIHDHEFNFESTVLLGTVRGNEYRVDIDPTGKHLLWRNDNFLGKCHLTKVREYEVECGETYEFGGPHRYHDHNHGSEEVMTYLRETDHYFYNNCYVLEGEQRLTPETRSEAQALGPSSREIHDEMLRVFSRVFTKAA